MACAIIKEFVLYPKCWDTTKDFKEGKNMIQFYFFPFASSYRVENGWEGNKTGCREMRE